VCHDVKTLSVLHKVIWFLRQLLLSFFSLSLSLSLALLFHHTCFPRPSFDIPKIHGSRMAFYSSSCVAYDIGIGTASCVKCSLARFACVRFLTTIMHVQCAVAYRIVCLHPISINRRVPCCADLVAFSAAFILVSYRPVFCV